MESASFWQLYSEASLTTLSFFWKALWAFILGYIVSSMIQVFVTRERMKRTMGKAGKASVALGTFFGFISSSCSFAALATTKALFKKGAGFVPSLAFLLASTNLVIELGFIIAVFLSWQFVVGEYVGGILLILAAWLIVRFTRPKKLIGNVRQKLQDEGGEDNQKSNVPNWKERITSIKGWRKVAKRYFMEWQMVWKDVTFGFTVAGIIGAFVPTTFYQTLFLGTGTENPSFLALVENTLIGPVAAFFTFIGSMGNIPIAAILFSNGVSFAGVIAFIFSDLVVFPVVRINAKYYGWKMALYIVGVFLSALVITALLLHYSFSAIGILPQSNAASSSVQTQRFVLDYTFWLNLVFLGITGVLVWLRWGKPKKSKRGSNGHSNHSHSHHEHHHHGGNQDIIEKGLYWLAIASYIWLAGGLITSLFVSSPSG